MNLTIARIEDLPKNHGAPTNFSGAVAYESIAAAENVPVRVARVNFAQGARTFWHVHTGEQVLYFLEGRGRVQVRGQPPVDAVVGDVVHIPPGAEHWHGAHPEEVQRMRHLAVSCGAVTWLEPVAEDEYRAR